ncbi:MAG TPA: inositol monophosphatase family protein [Bacteroidales bacterium]|mgnify:CR=1 FL=1|nr:inositol monophosphatase family protein [Bacteroidales bacterium]
MNLPQIYQQILNLCIGNGDMIKKEMGQLNSNDILQKGFNDFVTYVDTISEKRIVRELSKILPDAGFIVEEKTIQQEKKPLLWIIDPLDGTTNFIHGVPCFSISIALMKDNKVILGVVYEVMQEECFYSYGEGAWLNGKQIQVSATSTLADSLVGTGFPSKDFSKLEQYMSVLKYLFQQSQGVRRLGSAAVDLCYVACGRFDIFFEEGLSPWDVAAGAFIVEQAAGKVTEYNGGNNFIFGNDILATNKVLHNEMLKILNNKNASNKKI